MRWRRSAGSRAVPEFILRRWLSETDRRSDEQSGKGSQNDQDASYEEHGGRKDRAVVGYFRSDYIGKQTIISLIVITAAFLAGLGAYLVFHFSEVMGNIYSMDLVGTAKKILTLYLVAAVLYVAVTYVIYTVRYAKAKKRLQLFLEYLDCLDQDGEEETAERK